MDKLEEKFWAGVQKSAGCWLWDRGVGSHGYGQVYERRGRPVTTHRFSWMLHNGPIPAGLFVLHRCDNKRCVRPDHLFLGSQADNMADMRAKGRHAALPARRGEDAARAKITADAVRSIRASLSGGWSAALASELAAANKVTRQLIRLIYVRSVWRDVS